MNSRLVHIASYTHETDAGLAQAVLADNEIESFLSDTNVNSLYAGNFSILGGIKLHVQEYDYENAVQILKETGDQNFSSGEETIPACPKCGSENTRYKKITAILAFIFTGLLLRNLPHARRKIECINCGHSWKG